MVSGVAERLSSDPKDLGAFYTPSTMAQFLVEWAVRSAADRVLDPSFGGLVLLASAHRRLMALGCSDHEARTKLFGVEVDSGPYNAALSNELNLPRRQLIEADFFDVRAGAAIPRVEAVVGNPPFVRFQRFNGRAQSAHELAENAGVRLSRLSSSWAPFVAHATDFVAPGGRMAQVLPSALLHAHYPRDLIAFLRHRFASLVLVSFEERVFPGVQEDVVLLLADDYGRGPSRMQVRSVRRLADARAAVETPVLADDEPAVPPDDLLLQLLPRRAAEMYRALRLTESVAPLGRIASVDIGVVTGANKFFLLADGEEPIVPRHLLRATISKALHIPGATFARRDLRRLARSGAKYRLFKAPPDLDPPMRTALAPLFARGRAMGVDQGHKCRIRDKWWSVPLPSGGAPPPLLLTYCASRFPRLVVNDARVLHTNTIHGVRLLDSTMKPAAIVSSFYNSLTLLSAELVGRSYGGGVLKLEPSEAEALLVPREPQALALEEVDRLVRAGDPEALVAFVDPIVLGEGLGLSAADIELLRAAGSRLRDRRRQRARPLRRDP